MIHQELNEWDDNVKTFVKEKQMTNKKKKVSRVKRDVKKNVKKMPTSYLKQDLDKNIINKYMKQLEKQKLGVAIKDVKKAKIAKETSDKIKNEILNS